MLLGSILFDSFVREVVMKTNDKELIYSAVSVTTLPQELEWVKQLIRSGKLFFDISHVFLPHPVFASLARKYYPEFEAEIPLLSTEFKWENLERLATVSLAICISGLAQRNALVTIGDLFPGATALQGLLGRQICVSTVTQVRSIQTWIPKPVKRASLRLVPRILLPSITR
jgi:hypothetical protein